MSSYSQLYWLTRLDNIQGLFVATAVISGLLLLAYHICMGFLLAEEDWNDSALKKIGKGKVVLVWIICPISILAATLIPTKDEIIFIIAGGKTIDFIKHDSSINKIPAQSTKLITDFMQEQIDKMKSKK